MFGNQDTALDSDDPVGPAAAATHTLVIGVESSPSAPSSLNMAAHEHCMGVGGPITELVSELLNPNELSHLCVESFQREKVCRHTPGRFHYMVTFLLCVKMFF